MSAVNGRHPVNSHLLDITEAKSTCMCGQMMPSVADYVNHLDEVQGPVPEAYRVDTSELAADLLQFAAITVPHGFDATVDVEVGGFAKAALKSQQSCGGVVRFRPTATAMAHQVST